MLVNVCSAGSSGSTLFSHILNRHPKVYCGEEMGVFSKNIFYEDFNHLKNFIELIREYGISSVPYFEDRSILRNLEKNNLNSQKVWNMLSNSKSFQEFIKNLKQYILDIHNKQIWAEKTPENITTIKFFIDMFDAKIIHIIRDPRDVINSFMKRGLSMEEGADVWLSSIASIQPFRKHKNVLEIKYEDLVLYPKETIIKVCDFLNIKYMDIMLNPKYDNRKNYYFDSWDATPNDDINPKLAYKYKNLNIDYSKIYSTKLTKEFAKLQNTNEYYFIDLLKEYGYEYSNIDFDFYKQKKKEKFFRKKVKKRFYEKHNQIARVEL